MDWTSILKPVLEFGGGLYDSYTKDSARGDYGDLLQRIENENWQQGKNEYDAYVQWAGQADAARAANAAAKGAASRANANGRKAEDQRRIQAGNKAGKVYTKNYDKAMGLLAPFQQAGTEVLPMATNAYKQGINGLGMLQALLSDPSRMKRMDPAGPATTMNLGKLPAYLLR